MIIGSFASLNGILLRNPSLGAVPSFQAIAPLLAKARSTAKDKGCTACSTNRVKTDEFRMGYEQAMNGLSDTDIALLKSVLNVAKIEYYRKNTKTKLMETIVR